MAPAKKPKNRRLLREILSRHLLNLEGEVRRNTGEQQYEDTGPHQ